MSDEDTTLQVGEGLILDLTIMSARALYDWQFSLDEYIRGNDGWESKRRLQKVQQELRRRGLPVRPGVAE